MINDLRSLRMTALGKKERVLACIDDGVGLPIATMMTRHTACRDVMILYHRPETRSPNSSTSVLFMTNRGLADAWIYILSVHEVHNLDYDELDMT